MNKVILIGNLTKDIELKHTSNEKAVASFTVAINEYNDHTEFVDCVAWEKQAQNLAQYCGKGSKVAVEGRIRKRSYDAQDGTKRYVTEILCNSIEFLNTKQEQQQTNYQQPSYQQPTYQYQQPKYPPQTNQQPTQQNTQNYRPTNNLFMQQHQDSLNQQPVIDISEDDLPFSSRL